MRPDLLQATSPALHLLARLHFEVEPLLARYGLSEPEVDALLGDLLLLLIFRCEGVESPEIWLLAAIKRGCLRAARRRGTA